MALTFRHPGNRLEDTQIPGQGRPAATPPAQAGAGPGQQADRVTFGTVMNCSHLWPVDLSLLIFFIVLLLPPGSLGEKQLNEFSVARVSVYYKGLLRNAVNRRWMVAGLCYNVFSRPVRMKE